jgi:8-oxo-dGTP pyrophosphatase MutT (NUDIX family)
MTADELRAFIVSKLDPIEGYDPVARPPHSDLPADSDMVMRPAAVLVPLIEHEAGLTVLLTRRADSLRAHTGQVAFPGGRCDPGETPWEAALREAREEIGLESDYVSLAGLSTRYQTLSGFDITPVVGFVRPGFTLKANPDEVADIFETPFAFLMDPGNHERHVREQPGGMRRHFYAMPYEQRKIWGITAGMLRILYERLYGADEPSVAEGAVRDGRG